jgi:mono/diheme cytochrome c family protein
MHPIAIQGSPWWSGSAQPARAVSIALAWLVAWALSLGACQGSVSAESPPTTGKPADLASQVHEILSKHCTECHGPDSKKKKAKKKFSYALDLKGVADNPKLVVPHKPKESKLWQMVDNDEMPPPGEAKEGPLTEEQKKVIRDWIASGAPPPPSPPRTAPSLASAEADENEFPPTPFSVKHLLAWIGRFHVMVIHFPIALLLAAALGELLSAWRRWQTPWPPVQFCVLLGAAGAVVAVPLGWFLADFGGAGAGSGDILVIHRWIGTTVGACTVALAGLSVVDARRQQRGWLFRILLWISAGLVGAAGHFGGLLVHGEDFFNW